MRRRATPMPQPRLLNPIRRERIPDRDPREAMKHTCRSSRIHGRRWLFAFPSALELRQAAQLVFHVPQDVPRQGLEGAHEPAIVDRSALVDHDLALLPIASQPPR